MFYILNNYNNQYNNTTLFYLENLLYFNKTPSRKNSEIVLDNIMIMNFFDFCIRISTTKEQIETMVNIIISSYYKKLPKNLLSSLTKSITLSFSHEQSSDNMLDPFILGNLIHFSIILITKLIQIDVNLSIDYLTKLKHFLILSLKLVDDEDNVYYKTISHISSLYINIVDDTQYNAPILSLNNNQYFLYLVSSAVSLSIFINKNKNCRNEQLSNLINQLNVSMDEMNRDDIFSKCLQIDDINIKKLVMESYTSLTSYEQIESSELRTFITNITSLNYKDSDSIKNSFVSLFFFLEKLFRFHYENKNLILPLENKEVILFALNVLKTNLLFNTSIQLNDSIIYFLIQISSLPSLTSLFTQNPKYIDIIADIVKEGKKCFFIEKCYTMWNVLCIKSLIDRKINLYSIIGIKVMIHLADVLMNIPFDIFESNMISLIDIQIIQGIKLNLLKIASSIITIIQTNIPFGWNYSITLIIDQLPKIKEQIGKELNHFSVSFINAFIIHFIIDLINELYNYNVVDTDTLINSYFLNIQSINSSHIKTDFIHYQMELRNKISLFIESLSFTNIKYMTFINDDNKRTFINLKQINEINKQFKDFNLIFSSLFDWITSANTTNQNKEKEQFQWSDVFKNSIESNYYLYSSDCKNQFIGIYKDNNYNQNSNLLLHSFLRCIYAMIVLQDKDNTEGDETKLKYNFITRLQNETIILKKLTMMINYCMTANNRSSILVSKFFFITNKLLNNEIIIIVSPLLTKVKTIISINEYDLIYQLIKILVKIIKMCKYQFLIDNLYNDNSFIKKCIIIYITLIRMEKNKTELRRMIKNLKMKLRLMTIIKFYARRYSNNENISNWIYEYLYTNNIQIDEEIKIFIVVIIYYCSKRIENEDIIFHTNDIAIIEKEQLHLSSNKVLIQISKSNNTIYIGNSYEIEINRISSIKYYPVLNKISLYDDNNNKEFTLFFERVSDSFDFSCFIQSSLSFQAVHQLYCYYFKTFLGFEKKIQSIITIDKESILITEIKDIINLTSQLEEIKQIYIKKIEKVLYTQNEQSIKLQINSGIFDNTLIEFIDDITFSIFINLLLRYK